MLQRYEPVVCMNGRAPSPAKNLVTSTVTGFSFLSKLSDISDFLFDILSYAAAVGYGVIISSYTLTKNHLAGNNY
jgi:hypothetical protein